MNIIISHHIIVKSLIASTIIKCYIYYLQDVSETERAQAASRMEKAKCIIYTFLYSNPYSPSRLKLSLIYMTKRL